VNQYISHIEASRGNILSYRTKKEYLLNETSISSALMAMIFIGPIIYFVFMVWLTQKLNLNSSLGAALMILVPILLAFFTIIFACFNSQKVVRVKLKQDIHRKISMEFNNKKKEMIGVGYVRCAIHCYPLYDRRGKYKPIILIALELMKSEDGPEMDTGRIASVQCVNESEARMQFDHFFQSYRSIVQWLNLPIHKEQNIIIHSRLWWN